MTQAVEAPARTASTQMNTRIDRELKARGDAVFAQVGRTPSEAVRGLYEFAVAHEHEPQVVAEVLGGSGDEASRTAERERRLEALEEGEGLYGRACETLGVASRPEAQNLPYEELRERALLDEYGWG